VTVALPLLGTLPTWQAILGLSGVSVIGFIVLRNVATSLLSAILAKLYHAGLKHIVIVALVASGVGLELHSPGALTSGLPDLLSTAWDATIGAVI